MKLNTLLAALGLTVLGLVASSSSFARPASEIDASADAAVKHFYSMSPRNRELADKAVGMLVFGRVTKAGAGIAGEYGDGVLRVNGVTTGYYDVKSASVGLTLGVGEHREVILFMTQDSLDKFQASSGWAIGADAAVVVMKMGAGGEYDTTSLSKPILGFVFGEKGLLGDLSLEGSKITKIKSVR
jgi:lipid-binding SYLF domain-containing protein